MILAYPTLPSATRFDPYLEETPGAERSTDAEGMCRAQVALEGKEVMLATPTGIYLGRVHKRRVVVQGSCALSIGRWVAVSDHNGVRYVGYRALVTACRREGPTTVIQLSEPTVAFFYPGRRHPRVASSLDAQVVLEWESQWVPAETIDVSIGGLGVLVPELTAVNPGDTLTAHIRFPDTVLALKAKVQTRRQIGRGQRLGLMLLTVSAELETRIAWYLDGQKTRKAPTPTRPRFVRS